MAMKNTAAKMNQRAETMKNPKNAQKGLVGPKLVIAIKIKGKKNVR